MTFRLLQRRRRSRYQSHHGIDPRIIRKLLHEVWRIEYDTSLITNKIPPDPYCTYWYKCAQEFDSVERILLKLESSDVATALVSIVRDHVDLDISGIQLYIRDHYPPASGLTVPLTDKQALTALQFAVKLWLHVKPEAPMKGSLREATKSALPKKTDLDLIEGALTSDFGAKYLLRKADIRLLWTDSMEQHLELYQGNQGVYVFNHSSVLKSLISDPRGHPFPPGFLEETLRTLYLLFQPLDEKMERWNDRKYRKKNFDIDLELAMPYPVKLELKDYPYWHERLAAIQRAYNRKTPTGLTQWFFDTRNRVQWTTFWVAFVVLVLTILFGIIQCVTGIMQVYFALHP